MGTQHTSVESFLGGRSRIIGEYKDVGFGKRNTGPNWFGHRHMQGREVCCR